MQNPSVKIYSKHTFYEDFKILADSETLLHVIKNLDDLRDKQKIVDKYCILHSIKFNERFCN